jgi:hypothetical protein
MAAIFTVRYWQPPAALMCSPRASPRGLLCDHWKHCKGLPIYGRENGGQPKLMCDALSQKALQRFAIEYLAVKMEVDSSSGQVREPR